jgi:hypothetical protein
VTASPPSRTTRRHGGLLLALALVACATPPAGAPPESAFERDGRFAPVAPDVADQTAADVARAALLSRPDEAARAVHRLEAIDAVLSATEEQPTGLLPASLDLANTTLDDPRAYRRATRELLDRDGIDPALRARLRLFERDDPLVLANARMRDAWMLEFGRAFNTLAEPLGRSISNFSMAPYRVGRSVVDYAVQIYTREPLPLRQRQALAHWKDFISHHPDAPEAEALEPRVSSAQALWNRTQRNRALKVARRALGHDKYRLALIYADRALRHAPEDREASKLRAAAAGRLLAARDRQRRSLGAAPGPAPWAGRPELREAALDLLRPDGDVGSAASRLADAGDDSLADEARFLRALALAEAGREDESWHELEALADEDPARSNMARHAAALVSDPARNAAGAFRRAQRRHRWNQAKWVILGPFAGGARDRGLPRPLEWVIDMPSVAESMFSTPLRLIQLPFSNPVSSGRASAFHARRYLARNPDGEHADELRAWLEDWEGDRGNWLAALVRAQESGDASPEEIAELREKAAGQWLETAARERNRALRSAMYGQIAREFSETRAGAAAGRRARREIEGATAKRILVSRGFLEENPEVAGPEGFDLLPQLLDGRSSNGELHPDGVVLLGGSQVEVNYLAPSGDDRDPPRRVREVLDGDHLARVVSVLEETVWRNTLVDPDESVAPDAHRDAFFERARLGLADTVDARSSAYSAYAYRGLRERYGMVRARESILPFDLVVQGSLSNLSLGAFPRFRPPRETPDALLFK